MLTNNSAIWMALTKSGTLLSDKMFAIAQPMETMLHTIPVKMILHIAPNAFIRSNNFVTSLLPIPNTIDKAVNKKPANTFEFPQKQNLNQQQRAGIQCLQAVES